MHVGEEAGSQGFGFVRIGHPELEGPCPAAAQFPTPPQAALLTAGCLAHAATAQVPLAFLTFGSNTPPPSSL